MFMCKALQGIQYVIHLWQDYLRTRLTEHQCVGKIVDIFRGAGKVDKFRDSLQFPGARDLLFKKILDGLDIVICGLLDVLDALRILDTEIFDDGVQYRGRFGTQMGDLVQLIVGCKCL